MYACVYRNEEPRKDFGREREAKGGRKSVGESLGGSGRDER